MCVTLTVNLPEDLAARLAAEAARLQVSVEELVAQLVAARLPVDDDPLENFIGSGASVAATSGAVTGRSEPR